MDKIEGEYFNIDISYNNGDKYEGDFKNDLEEGKGIYYDNFGEIKYKGKWKKGKKAGCIIF